MDWSEMIGREVRIYRNLRNGLMSLQKYIGWIVDTLYEIWADWRLALTRRPDLATIIAERQKRLECKTLQRCRLTEDED